MDKAELRDGDPVGRELSEARARALHAGLATFEHDRSPVADAMREAFAMRLAPEAGQDGDSLNSTTALIPVAALQAARLAVLATRASEEIGDDAFHLVEEDLDWLEMVVGSKP